MAKTAVITFVFIVLNGAILVLGFPDVINLALGFIGMSVSVKIAVGKKRGTVAKVVLSLLVTLVAWGLFVGLQILNFLIKQ